MKDVERGTFTWGGSGVNAQRDNVGIEDRTAPGR